MFLDPSVYVSDSPKKLNLKFNHYSKYFLEVNSYCSHCIDIFWAKIEASHIHSFISSFLRKPVLTIDTV